MSNITLSAGIRQNLLSLQDTAANLTTTQEHLSTGKKINQPSDDPYGTSLALQLQSQIAGMTQYSGNIDDATAWTSASTTSLGNIDNMVQRVRELDAGRTRGSSSLSS